MILFGSPLVGHAANAAAPLVLAVPSISYESVQGPWFDLIYREAFGRLGLDIVLKPMPSKRASAMADAGLVDGDLHRSRSYGDSHPNMVRVEQVHFSASYAAYANTANMPALSDWASFDKKTLRVEYILGSVTPIKQLTPRIAPQLLSTVTDVRQGLRKLQIGRSDVLVAFDLIVDPLLTQPEFTRSGIYKVTTLEQVDGYLYLNKKHAALAQRLAAVLAQMKKEDRINQLGKQARLQWKPTLAAP